MSPHVIPDRLASTDPDTVLRHHLATAQSGHIFPIVTGHAAMRQHPRATVIYCEH